MSTTEVQQSAPARTEVERGAIRRFAQALGETDPVFFDVAAARAAGYPDLLAPPTFAVTLASGPIPGLQMPSAGNIHGEQEFSYRRPIYAGDKIDVVRSLIDTKEREGRTGRMRLVTFESRATDEGSELVFTARQVIIVRLSHEPLS